MCMSTNAERPKMFSGGAKLVPLPGAAAKVDPAALEAALTALPAGVVHHVQPAASEH